MIAKRNRLLPALIALGVVLTGGTAAAAAGLALHGKGELVNPPLSGDLEVVSLRLEPVLTPGGNGDLVLEVRNRSALTAVADRVRLDSPLRDARPAGCAAKVSGPLLQRNGIVLADDQRVTLRPGSTGSVVVPGALRLAASAKQGCGFRVTVDVQAIEADIRPPTKPPVSSPTPRPTPTSSPPAPPTTWPTPPPLPDLSCDVVDPDCA